MIEAKLKRQKAWRKEINIRRESRSSFALIGLEVTRCLESISKCIRVELNCTGTTSRGAAASARIRDEEEERERGEGGKRRG